MLARLAPTARRTVRGPAAHAVSAISRQAASTAGGASVTVTGTGFVSSAVVVFGDTDASTAFVNDTTLTATVPAHAEGVINIGVRQHGATQWLTDGIPGGAFEYLPAPTVTYISHDFEDGLVSPFGPDVGGGGSPSLTVGAFGSVGGGSQCARCQVTAAVSSGTACMEHRYTPNQPPLEPGGLYQRWYMRMTDATLDTSAPGQIKWLLNRSGTNPPSWFIGAVGAQAGVSRGQIAGMTDWNTGFIPDGSSKTSYIIAPDTWFEIQTHFIRSGGVGRMRMWIDGRLYIDYSSASAGTDDTAKRMVWKLGIITTQGGVLDGLMTIDIDKAVAGNGFLDPWA